MDSLPIRDRVNALGVEFMHKVRGSQGESEFGGIVISTLRISAFLCDFALIAFLLDIRHLKTASVL